jgi:hypothetical protein
MVASTILETVIILHAFERLLFKRKLKNVRSGGTGNHHPQLMPINGYGTNGAYLGSAGSFPSKVADERTGKAKERIIMRL